MKKRHALVEKKKYNVFNLMCNVYAKTETYLKRFLY